MFRLERWTAGALLGSWVAYWAALLGLTLGPGLLAAWRLTHGAGSHGTMAASIGNGRLLFRVNDAAGAAGGWTFGTSVPTALAWIALPPLAVWLVWLASRPRRDALASARVPLFDAPGAAPAATREQRGPERVERSP